MNGERGGPKATPTPVSPPSSTEAQHTSGLLASALDYAGRGWSVFPCEPGGKRPLGAAVPHGLHDASTSPTSVGRWWRRWPSANIGLVTGHAFDVLDVDRPKPGQPADGQVTLWELVAEHGLLPAGPTVATPSDGLHLYFAPTGLGNRAGLRPGLDYRGVGGYVLAPPSVLADGGTYTWLTTSPAGEVSEDRDDPGAGEPMFHTLPGWVIALLSPPAALSTSPAALTRPPGATGRPGGTAPPPGDRKAAYGHRVLESEALAVALAPVGQRNDTLNTAALKLGQVVAGGYLDAAEAVATLLAAAERAGLERREAEATIASGVAAGMAQPRRLAS